jgi:hypothetical protein
VRCIRIGSTEFAAIQPSGFEATMDEMARDLERILDTLGQRDAGQMH